MLAFIGGAFCGAVVGFMIGAVLAASNITTPPAPERKKELRLPHHRGKVIPLDKETREARAEAWWMK